MTWSAKRKGRFNVAAVGVSLAVAACTLFNPLDEYGPPGPKTPEASTTDASAGEDASGCQAFRWPPPPAKDDEGGPTEAEIILAAESLGFTTGGDAGTPPAFDLDNTCTCPGPPSCAPPTGTKPACDFDGGADTAGTDLMLRISTLAQSALDFNQQVLDGKSGFLVRIRSYNGGLDDTQVDVGFFGTSGNEGAEVDAPKKPLRDGNDAWTIDPRTLFGRSAPPYVPLYSDTTAYVSNGILVATLGDVPIQFGTVLTMKLTSVFFTARIVRDGGVFRLREGRVVGRWASKDLIVAFDTNRDPFQPDAGLCGASVFYQDLKKEVCASADLASDPALDNTNAPCNALAVLIHFTAGPAKLGTVFEEEGGVRRCGDDWTDECPK